MLRSKFFWLPIVGALALSGCSTSPVGMIANQDSDQFDNDRDGVINERDLCADTVMGAVVNNDGCPFDITSIADGELIVLFDHDSANIHSNQLAEVKRIVGVLNKNPGLSLVLEGHASASGSAEYNLQLSKKRAEAVKQLFVSRGLSAERLEILPVGEQKLLLNNNTVQADTLNRRVTTQFKSSDTYTDYKWHIYTMESTL